VERLLLSYFSELCFVSQHFSFWLGKKGREEGRGGDIPICTKLVFVFLLIFYVLRLLCDIEQERKEIRKFV